MSKALVFVEVDIEYCGLTYGEAPCTATLEGGTPTGTRKCFNSRATCQDIVNFDGGPVTLRFAQETDYLTESGIEAIACIDDIAFTPGTVSLGKDLGTRSSLRVTFNDFPWSDTGLGFDKYVAERPYDPFSQGSFWGKFRTRHPYMRMKPIRIIRGLLGQTLEEMETRHYVIDSFDGPTPTGKYSLIAKDPLKLADGDRAQAPRLSQGFLNEDIDDEDQTYDLGPAGIGNLEYPASGFIAIGGTEIISFTRTGDELVTERAEFNTTEDSHRVADRMQLCLHYEGEDPADIIADLLINYAGVPSEYIPLTDWKLETGAYLRTLYTTLIAEPTSVNTLVSELAEQAALAIWWDDINAKIQLRVLRTISTDAAVFGDGQIIENSLTVKDQPDKRISQVWVYYAQTNPLKPVDDTDNYKSAAAVVDLENESNYGTPGILKIYSRWIPEGGRAVALRVGNLQRARFITPPRKFQFNAFRYGPVVPVLGAGYQINAWPFQDDTGARRNIRAQVTRIDPGSDVIRVEAEEFDFDFVDDGDPTVIFDLDIFDVNARATFDQFYAEPESGDDVYFIVSPGVTVGSTDTENPAFDLGDWPEGVNIHIINRGRIQGRGGRGGKGSGPGGSPPATAGQDAGVAIYTRVPIILDNGVGQIFGGGGGGGGGSFLLFTTSGNGGGGGSGFEWGWGGTTAAFNDHANGKDGSKEAGGAPGNVSGLTAGGAGGDPGQPGTAGAGSPVAAGGAAGAAIDGHTFVTYSEAGDIRGPQIN